MHASWAMYYLKNLSLVRQGFLQTIMTSNMRCNTIFSKLTLDMAANTGTGVDSFGTSADYAPFDYPSATRVDAISGTQGTYARTYLTFIDIRRGGRSDNTRHHFYMEGEGLSGTYMNCCISAGPRGCSAFKSIQSETKIRNSVIAAAPDYDSGLASATTTERWASAMIDVKATSDTSLTNNAIYVARKTVSGTTYGTLVGVYWRARRTQIGANVPPYPDLLWSPPLGADTFFGEGSIPITGFAQGCETFVNDAYWAAVNATSLESLAHQYTFKKFIAYNTVTVQVGPTGGSAVAPYRDDGTYPLEATIPQANGSTLFGTHADWTDRSVTFLANNTHVGYQSPASSTPSTMYNLDDGLSVDVTEDGTGNAMRSYLITLSDGSTGYVRENQVNLWIRGWSSTLDARMTALGWDTTTTFAKFTMLNDHSASGTLSAESTYVGGSTCHIGGPVGGTERNIEVTISGTWAGTISLQRGNTATSFIATPVATWTANTTAETVAIPRPDNTAAGQFIRIGFLTGQYTSGTATVTIRAPHNHVTSSTLQAFWPVAIPKASRPLPKMVDLNLIGAGEGQRFDDVPAAAYIAIPAGFEL